MSVPQEILKNPKALGLVLRPSLYLHEMLIDFVEALVQLVLDGLPIRVQLLLNLVKALGNRRLHILGRPRNHFVMRA